MRKRHKSRAIAGLTALATVVAAGIQVMPAQATFGTADIKPIESNIAAKFWAKATASSGSSTAKLAIDGDPTTSWLADKAGPQRLTVDLGGAYDNLRKVRVLFARPDAVNQYVVEASSDGRRWSRIADDRARSRGAVHLFSRPGTRYVRLTIVGSPASARVAVSEFEVLNYLRDDLVLGADLSWMDDYQNRQYWVDPLAADRGVGPHLLDVVKDRGMQFSRLRIFNEPRSESTGEPTPVPRQGPDRSLQSAQWIKQRNMGLGIDFHYADSWADPSKQPKPRRWAELDFDDLTSSVYDFTAGYLRRLAAQGTVPDKVAVGNEIINGFMYGSEAALIGTTAPPYFVDQASTYQSKPGGGLLWKYWGSADPVEQRLYNESWDRFTTLAAAGIKAVRDASPRSKVEVHVIVDKGRLAKTMEFWHQYLTRVKAKGQNPDVLAISYYPEWHGTPEALETNLHTMATTYPDYELEVAETSYPASGGDGTPLPNSPFPRTVQGQADAIQRVFQAANDVVDNQGMGVLTWEPAGWQTMFRAVPELPNTWEPHASINVYNASRAKHILEDTVYTTTVVGQTPALPRTIKALTTASKRIAPVPVRWQALPPGATDTPGQVTVTGTTSRGQVRAVIDVVERTSAILPATQASAARYEAEAAPATCSGTIDTDHSGYSGTGFCNGANAIGAAAQFTVNATTAGTATVGIRFASGTATARPADVIVNGSRTAGTTFEGTGAWSTWSTKTLAVQVKAGSNTIGFSPTTAAGLPNVDYVDVEVTAGGSAGTGRLDDANLQYYGRWNRSNSSFYTMGWAGGYVDARFTGSSIGVRQRNAADLFYSIDGGPVRWRRNVAGNVTLATGLPSGSHSVRIGYRERAGSYNGDPGFGGLILAGGAQTAPVTRPQNLIEFIGDSITVGQPNADRPFVAYPWRTGEALGAAHTQVAEGGACLVSRDCIGMMDWFRRSSSRSTSDDWNFSTYQATGVVINLGTNDIGHGVSAAQFQQGYVVLLERVRRAYPNAHIFAMQTFRNRYVPETRNAVAARTAAGDSKVHFVDTTGWINSTTDLVDAVHPSPTGHAKIAQRLAPVLDQYL